MKPHNIFLRFFTFNLLLSVFFIFSQKIFENNYTIASPFLWILLMTAIPMGAAVYSRYREKSDRLLSYLFPAGMLYLAALISLHTYTFKSRFWEMCYGINPHPAWQLVWQVTSSGPLWLIVGMMEMHLYQTLSKSAEKTQWLAYLLGVTGFLSGMLIVFCLPVPSPFWLSILILLFFTIYHAASSLRLARKTVFIIPLLLFFIATDPYVRSPEEAYLGYDGFLKVWGSGTLKTKADIWLRNIHLTIAECSTRGFCGFYNNIPHWRSQSFPVKPAESGLGRILPQGATIAILGAGGGAQIYPLLANKPSKIYAVDIIPGLFDKLSDLGVNAFKEPAVETVIKDGRKFIAQSEQQFDLIYLPFTETSIQLSKSLFEPYNALFTIEAFKTYRNKLKPGGTVCITKLKPAQSVSYINHYIATLKAAGFKTRCLSTEVMTMIVGSLEEDTLNRTISGLRRFNPSLEIVRETPEKGIILIDDKPFYANMLFYFSPKTHTMFILLIISAACLLALIVIFILKYFYANGALMLPPLLCGINYTLLLLTFQLLLFFQVANPLDAAIIGNAIFITLALLGGILYKNKVLLGMAVIGCVISARALGLNYNSAILSGTIIISGGFFPRLLYYFREKLIFLLILDGLGAAIAGGIYLVVPTLLGIRLLFYVSLAVFTATLILIVSLKIRRA